jgi:hypothetical protein
LEKKKKTNVGKSSKDNTKTARDPSGEWQTVQVVMFFQMNVCGSIICGSEKLETAYLSTWEWTD